MSATVCVVELTMHHDVLYNSSTLLSDIIPVCATIESIIKPHLTELYVKGATKAHLYLELDKNAILTISNLLATDMSKQTVKFGVAKTYDAANKLSSLFNVYNRHRGPLVKNIKLIYLEQ